MGSLQFVVLAFCTILSLTAYVKSIYIYGTVPPLPGKSIPSGVRVIATDALGKIHSCLVTSRGDFRLHVPRPGEYMLELVGDTSSIYYNLRVGVGEKGVEGVEVRRDILLEKNGWDEGTNVEFVRKGPAVYGDKEIEWKVIVKWGVYLLVGTAFAIFVLWFPRLVDSLSDEGYEILTGERRLKIRDPNRVLRALWGSEEKRNPSSTVETSNRPKTNQASKKNK